MTKSTFEQTAWSLDDLFPALDAPEIQGALEQLEQLIVKFEAFRPQLTDDITPTTFNDLIQTYESAMHQLYRLYGFGSLNMASDTQDQQTQAYMAKIGQIGSQSSNRMLFFTLWWKDLDDTVAEKLIASAAPISYWLEEIRRHKPHILSEPEEKILNLKNVNGVRALNQIYSTIVNRYQFNLEENGEQLTLTRDEIGARYYSPDPDIRKAAYEELYRVYGEDAPILGQIYQFMMRDWRVEKVELRQYASPINVRNRYNDIPDEVVQTMMQVVRNNMPLFHRYFKIKAKWLGMEKLRRYDLYAPVITDDTNYDFDYAVKTVLESLKEFDPRFHQMALRVFDDNHYDSEVRPGKRGGAFCSTVAPDLTPWVLQSYQGKARDLATMAHELGHAIHAMMADHHSILVQHACLPLCETASTFSELLLIDKLMGNNPSPELKRDLLFTGIDDAYATIIRQTYFAQFEIDAHDAIENGATADDLCDLYMENIKEQFGDSVELSDDFKYEWVAIPHFFNTPFYVYAYSFGQLLAFSLYSQYEKEGKEMIPRYVDLLAAGGAESPMDILKKAGFDPYSADFWQGGFNLIIEQIEELEAMPVARTD